MDLWPLLVCRGTVQETPQFIYACINVIPRLGFQKLACFFARHLFSDLLGLLVESSDQLTCLWLVRQ